jgi:hypothetical protein
MGDLPNNWADIQADIVYVSANGLLVSFSSEQIKLGIKYDLNGKHLKAIQKGQVSARGNIGLVASQEEGFDLKSKILGKGGDKRFHAKFLEGVLHFPGWITEH